jgi:hypothetical protein
MALVFVLEDGTGLSTANAYIDVATFKQYWENRGITFTETDDTIKAWIIRATAYLDGSFCFWGEVVADDQALQFPRKYLCDRNNVEVASDSVPVQIENATAELAYTAKGTADLNKNSNISSKRIGPVSITYRSGIAVADYPTVNNYIKAFIKSCTDLDVLRV